MASPESTPGKHNTRESEKAPFYASGNIIEYNGMRGGIEGCTVSLRDGIKSRALRKKIEQSDLSRVFPADRSAIHWPIAEKKVSASNYRAARWYRAEEERAKNEGTEI
ncbi:hypothetical protein DBV15_06982, partial [Temnothorax longispinosus]